jgi:hypothetical protein
MFDRIRKDDLVAYADTPKALPLGIVKEVKEKNGKAVVFVYLFDINPEDLGTIKCVPYHKLERVSSPEKD